MLETQKNYTEYRDFMLRKFIILAQYWRNLKWVALKSCTEGAAYYNNASLRAQEFDKKVERYHASAVPSSYAVVVYINLHPTGIWCYGAYDLAEQ